VCQIRITTLIIAMNKGACIRNKNMDFENVVNNDGGGKGIY
jgi:hypothetical protein